MILRAEGKARQWKTVFVVGEAVEAMVKPWGLSSRTKFRYLKDPNLSEEAEGPGLNFQLSVRHFLLAMGRAPLRP